MQLADKYALIKGQMEELQKQLDQVKAEIKATGKDELTGDFATVTVSLSERTGLDQKRVKALLTAEQFLAACSTTLTETIRYKVRVEEAGAIRHVA